MLPIHKRYQYKRSILEVYTRTVHYWVRKRRKMLHSSCHWICSIIFKEWNQNWSPIDRNFIFHNFEISDHSLPWVWQRWHWQCFLCEWYDSFVAMTDADHCEYPTHDTVIIDVANNIGFVLKELNLENMPEVVVEFLNASNFEMDTLTVGIWRPGKIVS